MKTQFAIGWMMKRIPPASFPVHRPHICPKHHPTKQLSPTSAMAPTKQLSPTSAMAQEFTVRNA